MHLLQSYEQQCPKFISTCKNRCSKPRQQSAWRHGPLGVAFCCLIPPIQGDNTTLQPPFQKKELSLLVNTVISRIFILCCAEYTTNEPYPRPWVSDVRQQGAVSADGHDKCPAPWHERLHSRHSVPWPWVNNVWQQHHCPVHKCCAQTQDPEVPHLYQCCHISGGRPINTYLFAWWFELI